MKINRILFGGILSWLATVSLQAIDVTRLTCEMSDKPLALAERIPHFGWQMASEEGAMQSAYSIEVYTQALDGKKQMVWESGKVASTQSQHVQYGGKPLSPMARYYWRVRVWNEEEKPSAWSREAEFRLAPEATFFDAKWIGAITNKDAHFPEGRIYEGLRLKNARAQWDAVDSLAWRSICLRKDFTAQKQIADATVYVCGLGHYELTLNGRKVGDAEFAPLISDYDKTVYYNTYDVTEFLKKGENAVGVMLGNGFYNVMGGGRYRKLQVAFGAPTLLLQLVINYSDGTSDIIKSDADWKYDLSPVTFNTMYGGEDYDARLEQEGWDMPGFNDSGWRPVVLQEGPKGQLRPQQAPPVKIMERYDIKKVHKLTAEEVAGACKSTKRTVDPSAILFDMGQNLAGFPEITLKGKRGQKVTILVGEALTDENAVNQRQTGRQYYYTYTLKGDGVETWHPRFTYYGFRYIQVEGAVLKGEKNPDKLPVIQKLQSCFTYNSAPAVGTFECSNPIFTQAHYLIDRAVRSNMQGVFTDCPHREKLGWLEEVHLNGPGLLYNYDLTTFGKKVIRDVADAQRPDGMIPSIAPCYVIFEGPGMDPFAESPEWASTLILFPFMYYETYGDDSLIREYYPNMQRYVDYLTSRAENHIVDFGLGDWYDYDGIHRAGFSRNTSVAIVATAHYYLDLCKLVEAAKLVGNNYDAERYAALAEDVKQAFNERFFHEDTNQYDTGSQCANALAIYMDLVPADRRQAVLDNLVKDVKAHGTRLTTGDVGNRYLFQVLADNGLNELMYDMHNHEEAPGYGFQLKFGATTLTEQWDPRQGSSWNHFMMGQIEEWFYKSLVGLTHDKEGKGYQHMVIRPQAVGDLSHVKGMYETLYGEVCVEWTHKDGSFELKVSIPVNCTAEIYLPGDESARKVKSGTHTFTKAL